MRIERQLTGILEEELSRAPTHEWLVKMKGRLPVAPVLDVATALDSEFVAETG
jgi:crotonobetainyl-CoA:carnitine CoA-transferase CaiB-like acyl-CoA transferase